MRKNALFSLLLLVLLLPTVSYNQDKKPNLLQELLDLPSPPVLKKKEEQEHPEEFYDTRNPPPDDAPIEDLFDYWERQNSATGTLLHTIQPSEKSLKRMLDFCKDNPEKLTDILSYLPKDAEFVDFVKRAYDEKLQGEEEQEYNDTIKEWLKFNSPYFSDELYEKAQKVKDSIENNTDNEDELMALARVDWARAKPLLEKLENNPTQPISVVSAKWIFYQHALETKNEDEAEKYRKQLKEVIENRNARPSVRDKALDALSLTPEWEGRDDWYLSLMEDETLFDLREGEQWYTGLTTLITRTPGDKWIPKMIKLTKSSNPVVRNAAVRNLASLIYRKNKEVIEALLPWLANKNWAKEANGERLALITALGEVDVPESVSALISVVTNEDEIYQLTAAKTLAHYKDVRAVPALRAVLEKTKDEESRKVLIETMIACGGFSDDEQLLHLEAYAKIISTPEGKEEIYINSYDEGKPLPLTFSIGTVVSEQEEPTDGLVIKTLNRIKTLRKNEPEVATALFEIVRKWQSRVIDLELLDQIDDRQANVETVVAVLARREQLQKRVPNEIAAMITKGGVVRGIGATLSGKEDELASVLSGSDIEAKITLLACARLLRVSLPLKDVGDYLNDENKQLALAAEHYLESEDSTEARSYVLEKHPNEARILGARDAFFTKEKPKNFAALNELFMEVSGMTFTEGNYSGLKKMEEKLRAEIKETPDLIETYSLLTNSLYGHIVVRVYKNKTVLTWYEDVARYREITLSKEELNSFESFLAENKIKDKSPQLFEYARYKSSEFLTLSRNGGRRVFIQESPEHPKEIIDLLNRFEELSLRDDFKLFYQFADKVKGLEILLASNRYFANTLWKNNDDFRVLIEDKEKEKEIIEEVTKRQREEIEILRAEADSTAARDKFNKLQSEWAAARYAHYSWRKFENGKLANVVEPPLNTPYFPEITQVNGSTLISRNSSWNMQAKDFKIEDGYYEEKMGLWKIIPSQNPVLIKEGYYRNSVLTPDEKWVISTKQTQGSEDSQLVRINLQTGKEFVIKVPQKGAIVPIIYVPAQNKVLVAKYISLQMGAMSQEDKEKLVEEIRIVRESGEEVDVSEKYNELMQRSIEYYLLDANTGSLQSVKGETSPLSQQTFRSLQPTGNPNEFWAAIPDNRKTEIGRYDMKTLSFKSLLAIPDISFNSMDMWVDEKAGKVYFVYKGHLLSLPLTQTVSNLSLN